MQAHPPKYGSVRIYTTKVKKHEGQKKEKKPMNALKNRKMCVCN